MKEVFCNDCKHSSGCYCFSPDNLKIINSYNRKTTIRIGSCWDRNGNNNCPSYKRSWYRFWVKEVKG